MHAINPTVNDFNSSLPVAFEEFDEDRIGCGTAFVPLTGRTHSQLPHQLLPLLNPFACARRPFRISIIRCFVFITIRIVR